ncbi:xanthine dehydrogenase accessory factor [Sphaerisporangium melleum]|uniref:Xanthine dehydrogenase accessory factor n=1 Tax=Sphaerisporangium melleum TaxID=321316 RepID=A0A917QRZ2_9ACTN|nr:XdhC family protein [Sphaerisporangium melleum]GGK64855.1 xanthine dehydrogenase accessory factor [Sphaerisporangium melleum]GII70028.1 xanthine dehydrogenase accessory factor [Sphaerisporangium melleum]
MAHSHDDHVHEADPACAVAHGEVVPDASHVGERVLVAVFASPVADHLLRYGADLGYRAVLLEPDSGRAEEATNGAEVVAKVPAWLDATADVVVTDHDRPELGDVLHELLAYPCRWIGVMGSPRHTAPHVAALAERGVPPEQVARVHRPIGLNIGSKTPPEIAISTLAGLLADRNGRPGGFGF